MNDVNKDLIIALDIGTSKVVVMIAEVTSSQTFNVIGIGQSVSRGMKKGMVVNIEETIKTIEYAIQEAEVRAGYSVRSVCTGIAGSHIHSFNSSGMVAVRDDEITQNDVLRVLDTARAVHIPADQQILHVMSQEFKVDGQEGIRYPVGMSGMRLEVKVHIITGSVSAAQNIVKCIRRCGLDVAELCLQPLASAEAVLTKDERDLGVALVDIGGGTTDIAVFVNDALRHTAVIPIAGDQVTNDISLALRTPMIEAEDLKQKYGAAKLLMVSPESMIEIPGVGERVARRIKRQSLAAVIEPRLEELFLLVQRNLVEAKLDNVIVGGVVLTGGTSLLPGIRELAEEVFLKPVRVAQPAYDGNLSDIVCNPRFATVVGLLHYLLKTREEQYELSYKSRPDGEGDAGQEHKSGVLLRMKNWFSRTF